MSSLRPSIGHGLHKHMVSPPRLLCAVFAAGLALVQSAPQSEPTVEAKVESRIYFARQLDGDRGRSIVSVRPDGTGERVEVPYKSGMGENNPAPSPDGSYLLFNTYRYGGWKIAKKAGQGAVERWTLSADYYTNPAFDHKGTRVAFEHTRRSGTDVSVRALSTSDEAAWTSTKARDERVPVWTSDGGLVYFDGRSGKQQVYLQPTKDAETKLLSDGQGNDFAPAMSPDGQHVAFYSDRTGHADLMVLDLKKTSCTTSPQTSATRPRRTCSASARIGVSRSRGRRTELSSFFFRRATGTMNCSWSGRTGRGCAA